MGVGGAGWWEWGGGWGADRFQGWTETLEDTT